jgi:hypothetical protein
VKDAIAVFEEKGIRRVYDEKTETWYFSVVDIVQVLTEQLDYQTARKYWNKLKERLKKEGSETVTNCHQLKLTLVFEKPYGRQGRRSGMQNGCFQFFGKPVAKITRARFLSFAEKFSMYFRRYLDGNAPGKWLFWVWLSFEVKVNGFLKGFVDFTHGLAMKCNNSTDSSNMPYKHTVSIAVPYISGISSIFFVHCIFYKDSILPHSKFFGIGVAKMASSVFRCLLFKKDSSTAIPQVKSSLKLPTA